MKKLTPAQRAFLENPFIAVVTTLRPDGSPHSTPVWVDVDDEGVSFNTARPRTKPSNLAEDRRLSLVVVDPGDPYRWIAITGTGTLVDEGANAQIDRLAKKYTGRERYASHREGETRVSVRISPTFIESRGLEP
ncbi:MAG TPA: PPOX class F420-dependent oxidoreductase [Gaiellaceae bacterium]|nr:PPOX class F420-dependent oxidoreductase [Gaiellaceae bacterium]